MVAEVHQSKPHQQIGDLLTSDIVGLVVGVEVTYHYGILVPEACQGLR